MQARVLTEKLSQFVAVEVIRANKLDGVRGKVSEIVADQERIQLTWDHNNDGDECNHSFWFDFNQVIAYGWER